MTTESALAVFSGVTILVSVVIAIIQWRETRRITQLTSQLQEKLDRLSKNLDYRIARLQRVRDLCKQIHSNVNNRNNLELDTRDFHVKQSELIDFLSELQGTLPSIGDSELTTLVEDEMLPIITELASSNMETQLAKKKQTQLTMQLARAYQRLEQLTDKELGFGSSLYQP